MEINELKNSKKGARTARSRLGSLSMKHLVLVVVVAVVVLVGVRALGASICLKMAMQPVPLKPNFGHTLSSGVLLSRRSVAICWMVNLLCQGRTLGEPEHT